jgi:alcohol dehydrogenase YqhD (iron-dependent ADH family)
MQTVVKALDAISGAATPSESVADAILALDGLVISDGAAAVAAALEPEGDIATAISTAVNAKTAALQADSEATTAEGLVADFNALLAKLQAAGLMAEE